MIIFHREGELGIFCVEPPSKCGGMLKLLLDGLPGSLLSLDEHAFELEFSDFYLFFVIV
jgi:hypothetical protein